MSWTTILVFMSGSTVGMLVGWVLRSWLIEAADALEDPETALARRRASDAAPAGGQRRPPRVSGDTGARRNQPAPNWSS